MTNQARRPIIAATAITAALTVSALGAGAALAQPGDEMPADDAMRAIEEAGDGNAADDAAAAAGFTLVTDEMGNTRLVRDPDAADPAGSVGEASLDVYDEDDDEDEDEYREDHDDDDDGYEEDDDEEDDD